MILHIEFATRITYVGVQPCVTLRGGFKALVALPAFSNNSWPSFSDHNIYHSGGGPNGETGDKNYNNPKW